MLARGIESNRFFILVLVLFELPFLPNHFWNSTELNLLACDYEHEYVSSLSWWKESIVNYPE
jgi:hypothetical protein